MGIETSLGPVFRLLDSPDWEAPNINNQYVYQRLGSDIGLHVTKAVRWSKVSHEPTIIMIGGGGSMRGGTKKNPWH